VLQSKQEERGRRFKLALRAGIPILLLFGLLFYRVLLSKESTEITPETGLLLAASIFISIYFIYFLLEEDPKETLLDQLTQGFNEQAFIKNYHSAKPKSLAIFIIRNLDTINENYGSKNTNTLLYSTVHRLHGYFKEHNLDSPLIGRRFGAEFLIAIDKPKEEFKKILETFTKEYSTINGIELDYGFAIAEDGQKDIDKTITLLKDQIICNTNTKNNTSETCRQSDIKDAEGLSKLEKSIVQAVEYANFQLSFRPLLNTKTNHIDMYEISAKLYTEEGGGILPRVYLPIINRLGLGREYDFALLKHIIDLLPLINQEISFTFNLSPFSLRDSDFKDRFFDYLKQSGIEAHRLVIQLYERKTHHNLSGYLATLKDIRSKGIRICIDNFGSSNASMEYMKHFKFDMVQFDRDYVTNLDDKTSYSMLESLTRMSNDLHIQTVAKWVDKEDQKQKLKALGINYLQGFGIAKPMPESVLINKENNEIR
jgi:EAL domain-containing protein (putative c-di-GMP-specific phosphodiesterase class I)/GGDEF domain-containing protein